MRNSVKPFGSAKIIVGKDLKIFHFICWKTWKTGEDRGV